MYCIVTISVFCYIFFVLFCLVITLFNFYNLLLKFSQQKVGSWEDRQYCLYETTVDSQNYMWTLYLYIYMFVTIYWNIYLLNYLLILSCLYHTWQFQDYKKLSRGVLAEADRICQPDLIISAEWKGHFFLASRLFSGVHQNEKQWSRAISANHIV